MKEFARLFHNKIAIIIFVVAIIIVYSFALQHRSTVTVRNFEECKKAGGAILESYPEQCLLKGNTYTNESQSSAGQRYVGLGEEEALKRAKESNVPARVVERDGESLPVTMDYVIGRLNFSIREGKVTDVSVEGE